MGYYDNEGQYHSFRQGVSKAAHKVAEHVAHPIHPHRHHHSHEHSFKGGKYEDIEEEVVVKEKYTTVAPTAAPARPVQSGAPVEEVVRVSSSYSAPAPSRRQGPSRKQTEEIVQVSSFSAPAPSRRQGSARKQSEEIVQVSSFSGPAPSRRQASNRAPAPATASYKPFAPSNRPTAKMTGSTSNNTITIPCHHIRIGDLLILQGRPCQVIRITTSSQTGQHRYLGVDLFTKQLHEESSFISNPAPSVIVQNMLGPVFKQYRVLDIREDGRVVAMTEGGDVKQGLPVLDQSGLSERLSESFDNGRGSVRILVINDDGMEMAVDYKVVHGSRL